MEYLGCAETGDTGGPEEEKTEDCVADAVAGVGRRSSMQI
jgi:hypothetical protein